MHTLCMEFNRKSSSRNILERYRQSQSKSDNIYTKTPKPLAVVTLES